MHLDDEGLPPHMEIANIEWRLAYLRGQQAKQNARQRLLQYCYATIIIVALTTAVVSIVTKGDLFVALFVVVVATLALVLILYIRSLLSAEGREMFDQQFKEDLHHPHPADLRRTIAAWERRLVELKAQESGKSS
jgi:Flp pilus assembly protein TadB